MFAPAAAAARAQAATDSATSRWYRVGVDSKRAVRVSKLLSFGLRHRPDKLGLDLDAAGWADVHCVLESLAQQGERLTAEELSHLVATSDKQRFALSEDGTRIRANQGHSIAVELGLTPREPPPRLYHGTVDRFLGRIRVQGLLRGSRTHVHLSIDEGTARVVAARRKGRPIILTVRAGEMHADGIPFFLSDNRVWLTEHVPARYLD
jgi:putative RNA 2'-phosphotransferase